MEPVERSAALVVGRRRGWEVVTLRSDQVAVDVVPAKGGDIIGLRSLQQDVDVLWTSPWGLRHRDAPATGADSVVAFFESYPGGWQTIFPNGGEPSTEAGVEQGFHGEAAQTAWDWRPAEAGAGMVMEARLCRSPFVLRRTLSLAGDRLQVEEVAVNVGINTAVAMWSHHPAFGAPFLSGDCIVEAAARSVLVDAERDTPVGDLRPGARSAWPFAVARGGEPVDLRRVPADGAGGDRLAYLTDFTRGFVAVTNPVLGLRVELEWDHAVLPHAWYWLENRATAGFPWYGRAYVLAIEPASSHPGHGLGSVRRSNGTLLHFEPGQTHTVRLACRLRHAGGGTADA